VGRVGGPRAASPVCASRRLIIFSLEERPRAPGAAYRPPSTDPGWGHLARFTDGVPLDARGGNCSKGGSRVPADSAHWQGTPWFPRAGRVELT